MAKNEEEKLQVEEDREKVEEPAEEEEPTEFVGLQEIDSLKVRQLWAGIPNQATAPTDSAQRGELRLYDDTTDQRLYARLSGAWKKLADTGGMDPAAHKATHESGGTDEIDATGLTGVPDLGAEGFSNIASNGNFEHWSVGTTQPPSFFNWVLTPTVARDTSPKYGAYCAKVTGAGAANEGISHTLTAALLKPSTTYHISVWAKATAGDTAKLDITGESGTFTALTTTSESWTQLTGTFDTDSTPTPIVIQLLAAADTDIVWFDGLQVTEGSTLKVYQAGQDRYNVYSLSLGIAPSDDLLSSADTARLTSNAAYTLLKEIEIDKIGGDLRIKFDLRADQPSTAPGAYGQIWKNGAAIGTERTDNTGNYVTFSEDLTGFLPGDLIQIYAKKGTAVVSAYVQNFRIYGTYYQFTVNTD